MLRVKTQKNDKASQDYRLGDLYEIMAGWFRPRL